MTPTQQAAVNHYVRVRDEYRAYQALSETPTLAEVEGVFTTEPTYEDHLGYLDSQTVYCSMCDGIGHGQPGHGPCPLEERGYSGEDDARDRAFGW